MPNEHANAWRQAPGGREYQKARNNQSKRFMVTITLLMYENPCEQRSFVSCSATNFIKHVPEYHPALYCVFALWQSDLYPCLVNIFRILFLFQSPLPCFFYSTVKCLLVGDRIINVVLTRFRKCIADTKMPI